ncbi:MAG: ATP-binding cassette domain-containing protein [Clostridium sp.]|nr:ATP-binding cassette domain-containing protein [Clostridium sp.]
MLEISKLNKSYKSFQALKDISLKIDKGVFGLLGPNGAGKTTLMKCIATLITDFTGDIKYEDVSWVRGSEEEVKSLIGYLPQRFTMYKNLTVYEALEHIQILKIGKKDEKELRSILNKVNLIKEKDKKINSLSGGMLRRVGIAQAIIGNPKILIIDEPTAGLDPMERVRFRSLIYSLAKENIVIISTHIVEDLEAIAASVAFIKNGEIIKCDKVGKIIENVEGEIYEVETDNSNLDYILQRSNVISIKSSGKKTIVRFLGKVENGTIAEATLEDAYYKFVGVDNYDEEA